MAGTSLEGWRLRRGTGRDRLRPPRAIVSGEGPLARDVVRRLEDARTGEAHGAARAGEIAADVVLICDDGEAAALLRARVGDVSLKAARACPFTAIVIVAAGAIPLCVEAARASGLPPWLVLAPGGMPMAASAASRLAASAGVAASQIQIPVVGGDPSGGHGGLLLLERYACVAGIPLREITRSLAGGHPAHASLAHDPQGGSVTMGGSVVIGDSPHGAAHDRHHSPTSLAASAARLARAVLADSRLVLSCTAWVEGSFGMPGGFVTVPIRVGARGAETPLPLRLTLDERALLQRVAGR